MIRKIKKLVTNYIAHRKLQAQRKRTWQNILEIHHMFD